MEQEISIVELFGALRRTNGSVRKEAVVKKYVSLKKLHARFPMRTDFKPTLWNWVRFVNYVENTDNENCIIVKKLRLVTVLPIVPFLVVALVVWRGLSALIEIAPELKNLDKPVRTDDLRYDEYLELTK